MDLQQVGQFVHDLIAQHEIIYTLIVAPLSIWLLNKAEAKLPAAVDWVEEYQDRQLKRAGLSEEQIIAVEDRELKDLRASADELEKKIAARRAALTQSQSDPAASSAP